MITNKCLLIGHLLFKYINFLNSSNFLFSRLNEVLVLYTNLSNIDLKDGSKILWHIFWNKKEEVEKEIWNTDILSALAPIVMWFLWKANSNTGSSANSLLSWDSDIMKIAGSFLDKNWDWNVKDDLLWMAMKKFF
jgi:hypothetical protein